MARDETTSKIRSVTLAGPARPGARKRPDDATDSDDVPIPHEHEDSAQVLIDGISAAEKGSPTEKALHFALNLVIERQKAGAPASPPAFTPASLKRWAVAIVACLGIVSPIVGEIAGTVADVFRPNVAVIERLDATNTRLEAIESSLVDVNKISTALVTWSIDCERARSAGANCDRVPPVLNLVAAKAEAAKDQ